METDEGRRMSLLEDFSRQRKRESSQLVRSKDIYIGIDIDIYNFELHVLVSSANHQAVFVCLKYPSIAPRSS